MSIRSPSLTLRELDKTFKKIKEGLQEFDYIYNKFQSCESAPQREKLENDLKKEIKRLQKSRDLIKNWMSGNEVKDKKQLIEHRKLIEHEMERFKEVEKEMKTKAFSKEGLNMAQKIDPKDKEKAEMCAFIQSMIEELAKQTESLEATLDQLQSSMKKGKKAGAARQEELSDTQSCMKRTKWHQEKLETILRFIENGQLEAERLLDLKEDIQYYVESNEDSDFADYGLEELYDELDLDSIDDTFRYTGSVNGVGDVSPHESEDVSPSSHHPTPAVSSVPVSAVPVSAVPVSAVPVSAVPISAVPISAPVSSAPTAAPISSAPQLNKKNSKAILNPATNTATPSANNTPKMMYASVAHSAIPEAPAAPAAPPGLAKTTSNLSQSSATAPMSRESTQSPRIENAVTTKFSDSFEPLIATFTKVQDRVSRNDSNDKDWEKALLESSLLNCPDSFDSDKPHFYQPPLQSHPTSVNYPQEPLFDLISNINSEYKQKEGQSILSKMELDTLLYIFYFHGSRSSMSSDKKLEIKQNGSYLQLLAAKELSSRGWFFNTQTRKWFNCVKEQQPGIPGMEASAPQVENVWKYFDYEGMWLPRRVKDGFEIDDDLILKSF